jgi:hypothetical protein
MGNRSRIRGKVTGSYPDVALDIHTRTLEGGAKKPRCWYYGLCRSTVLEGIVYSE